MAKVLVISPTPSHPQDAGNRARIFSLLSGLKTAGQEIHFAFVKMESGDEANMVATWDSFSAIPYRRPAAHLQKRFYDRWAKRLGSSKVLPFTVDDWYSSDITPHLERLRDQIQPDVILVEYVYLSKAFECFASETLKVLDTHDLFGDRHKMYVKHGLPPVFFYTSPAEEQRGLQRADVVLAIQKEEAEHFASQTSARVLTVGHLAMPGKFTPAIEPEAHRILFVGSRNHINSDAINWFIDEVFPRVREMFPEIELDIVGGCTELLSKDARVNLIGRVDELAPYYARATLVINPLQFGTGLKIKTIEALSVPRPLVTTAVGAAGLDEWQDRAFLVADTPDEFATAIERLINSPQLQQKLCVNASEFISGYNQNAIEPLLQTIGQWKKAGAVDSRG